MEEKKILVKTKVKKRPDMISKRLMKDPRFSNIYTDPTFKDPSAEKLKVKVDERFKSVFNDKKFSSVDCLDPRGRPKSFVTNQKLNKFYDSDLSDSENEDKEIDRKEIAKLKFKKKAIILSKKKKIPNENYVDHLIGLGVDVSRGDRMLSDSSDDDSTTTDEEDLNYETADVPSLAQFDWGEIDNDAAWEEDVEQTHRLALCNQDWSTVRAVDIMAIVKSFVPSGGGIHKVSVYKSEFGKEKMKEEEEEGPSNAIASKVGSLRKNMDTDDAFDTNKKPGERVIEALRHYKRDCMRYYYAVIVCNSPSTADAIYRACDRTMVGSGGQLIDLRFIPNDTTFDDEPHDECEDTPETYEPMEKYMKNPFERNLTTLHMDETSIHRQVSMKKYWAGGKDDKALQDLIASSDSDDTGVEEEEEDDDDDETNDGETKSKSDKHDDKERRITVFRSLIKDIRNQDKKKKKKHNVQMDVVRNKLLEESDDDDVVMEVPLSDGELESEGNDMQHSDEELQDEEEESIFAFGKGIKNEAGEEGDGESEEEEKVQKKKKKTKQERRKKAEEKKENKQIETVNSDLALLVEDDLPSDKKHFDRAEIQRKNIRQIKDDGDSNNKQNKEDSFKLNMKDDRFSALLSGGSFNLDQSHPMFDPGSQVNHMMAKASVKNPQNVISQIKSKVSKSETVDVTNLINKIKMKKRK